MLRAHDLLNTGGQTGLIATNTLAQGDTREVGLDQLVADGVTIRRAVKSEPWPSRSAVLEYCAVWTSRAAARRGHARQADGVVVVADHYVAGARVAARGEASIGCWPTPALSFQGINHLGSGFTMHSDRRQRAHRRRSA